MTTTTVYAKNVFHIIDHSTIAQSQMKIRGNGDRASKTNDFLVGGVFIVTVINVFAAAFTTTDKVN